MYGVARRGEISKFVSSEHSVISHILMLTKTNKLVLKEASKQER